jgi:hypothetical protein
MNIILVSGRLARARTITLDLAAPSLLGVGASSPCSFWLACFITWPCVRRPEHVPYLHTLLFSAQQRQDEKTQSYLRENLNALAVKLGEMQAQLMRLDTIGERLAKIAGFKPQDLMFGELPGRGGAQSTMPQYDLSLSELTRQLDWLTRRLDDRGDMLGVLESSLTLDNARKKLVPRYCRLRAGGTRRISAGASIPSADSGPITKE